MKIKTIGRVHSPYVVQEGTPIQPSAASGVRGSIEVFPEYADGLEGLDGFDRIWVIYWCHLAGPVHLKVRPYLDDNEHGVFATRSPSRPNPIGMSCLRLVSREDNILHVEDIDILDGTPLIDIKPYVPAFDVFTVERAGWLDGKILGDKTADGRFSGSTDAQNEGGSDDQERDTD